MLFGAVAIVVLLAAARAMGQGIGTPPADDPRARPGLTVAISLLLVGTLLGPILGMILFLYSALLVKLALATTILALTPVAVLPFNHLVDRSPITRRALAGAILGVIGVSLLAFAEPSHDAGAGPRGGARATEAPSPRGSARAGERGRGAPWPGR